MIKVLTFLITFLGLISFLHAKPMDSKTAEEIPELREIVINLNVKQNYILSEKDQECLIRAIDSKDPVLLSAAVWIIGETKENLKKFSNKIEILFKDKANLDEMSVAFITIALNKQEALRTGINWQPDKLLLDSSNQYLCIETARALLKDSNEGKQDIIKKLQMDERPMVRAAAKCFSMDSRSNTPMLDERYELLLSIIRTQ